MEASPFENRIDMQQIQEAVASAREAIGSVLVGQEETVTLMLAAMLARGHVLLEGVPGVAKTLTAKLMAKTMDVGFSRIQFTPDLLPSDVMGTNVFNPKTTSFEFRKGPVFSNIVLIDEINRAPAKTQSSLFEVMEERSITVDGTTYVLDAPFMVVATQNPVEHEGTYQLPEAQLDRFAFKLLVDYPSAEQEVEILKRHQAEGSLHAAMERVEAVMHAHMLDELQQLTTQVKVEEKLLHYIAQLVRQTRKHRGLVLGASPRGSITILSTAKAIAALSGRDFVLPDDILYVAVPALRHRITLSAEKEMEGVRTDDMVKEIIAGLEIPR